MTIQLHGENIIGGESSVRGSARFRTFDPAANKTLEPEFCEGTVDEVDAALKLAVEAFETYRSIDPKLRAAFLERIGQQIMALGDALLHRAAAETGLAVARLVGERARTVYQLDMFAALIREGSWVEARIDRAQPDRQPIPKPDLRRRLVPLGPVVVFGASNFPFAYSIAGGDTASALAAGCPVIAKAHPAHAGTCEMVAHAVTQAVEQAKMPPGVFSMIHGRGNDVGMALVKHPLTAAVGFTGSLAGGRALFDAAAARPVPIPVYAEMGSTNPVFILPGALKERGQTIARELAQSVTLGVGQFCTNPGLVVIPPSEAAAEFIDQLAGHISAAAPGSMLHPGIRQAYERGVERLNSAGGVRLIGQSTTKADAVKNQAAACLFTTEATAFFQQPQLSQEVFGPSTLAVATGSIQELEQIARILEGHLTATIHATEEDLKQHAGLIAVLETKAGRLIFNGYPTGVEVCPSMQHGGPYPATTDARTTSVGTAAITRFARPVCYQNFPQAALPVELRDGNPRRIWRLVDGQLTRDPI